MTGGYAGVMQSDWIEHRRAGDRERVGWMRPVDDGFVAVDLLGRERTGIVDWLEAEELLDELGLRYLADPYELLLDDGHWLRVRIADVSPEQIRVKKDDWGDMTAPQIYYTVPFPADPNLLREFGGAST